MSDDIVEVLRGYSFAHGEHADDCWKKCRPCACQRAADEIEQLRTFITEWVDAEAELEDSGYWTDRYADARDALCEAVGR